MAGPGDPPNSDARSSADEASTAERAATFVRNYRNAVERYSVAPSEAGLQQAYELGRHALQAGTSLLELVDAHRSVQQRFDGPHSDRHEAADRFFTEALAAFELAQRGYTEARQAAHTERARADLARGLTRAYLAVAAQDTAIGRCTAAAEATKALLQALDARVELEWGPPTPSAPGGRVVAADLPGGSGRLVAIGATGRSFTDGDRASLEQLAVLVHGPINDARLLAFAGRLDRLGALLGAEADPATIIDRILADGLELIAASSGAILLPVDGHLRLAGAGSAPGSATGHDRALDELASIANAGPSAPPVFLLDPDELARWADSHGVRRRPAPPGCSWALLPLRSRRAPPGTLALRFDQPQPFDAAQRSFLTQTGERIADALDRGRLYANERAARRAAESATRRVALLRELANELSHADTRRSVADILARYVTTTTDARFALVAGRGRHADDVELLADYGKAPPIDEVRRELTRAAAFEAPLTGPVAGSPASGGAGASVSSTVGDQLRAEGVSTIGIHPLIAGSRRIGGVLLAWDRAGSSGFDLDGLESALAVAGPALDRAGRYDTDHDIAVTLQRSLLTDPEITVPGVEWSAQYRSGGHGVAGGDWYDVIALSGRATALAIGDIVGKGVEAAAAMGQLRSATRALTQRIKDPAELLQVLDDYTGATGQGLYSSMAFAVFDPSIQALHHAVAGHPPPLLRSADGEVRLVDTGRGPLLGIPASRATATIPVRAGDTLVLFTDGLIERRHRPLQAGLSQLSAVVQAGPPAPDQLCRHILGAMDDGRTTDDIAILAARFSPLPGPAPSAGARHRPSGDPEGRSRPQH